MKMVPVPLIRDQEPVPADACVSRRFAKAVTNGLVVTALAMPGGAALVMVTCEIDGVHPVLGDGPSENIITKPIDEMLAEGLDTEEMFPILK